jgi:hypothetical protein
LAPTRSYFHPVLRCRGWAGRCCRRFGRLGRYRTWRIGVGNDHDHVDHRHDAHNNHAELHPVFHECQLEEDHLVNVVSCFR